MAHSRYIWNKLRRWHPAHYRDYPWREPEICPWGILLAEMLLRRTDGPTVAKVFPPLYAACPTPRHMAAAGHEEILAHVRPLGLWGQRCLALAQLSNTLVECHRGEVPRDRARLLALPHVGPYVAGAVMVFAYGRPATMPDVNIIRIMSRFFSLPAKTPANIRDLAQAALAQIGRASCRERV